MIVELKEKRKYKLINPCRVENDDGTLEETSFLIKHLVDNQGSIHYHILKIITLKDNNGMILDESVSERLTPFPENAIFNVSCGWTIEYFSELIESLKNISKGRWNGEDIDRVEALFR